MLKIRLSDFDFQSVAKAIGLSVAVLLEHYDEVLLPEIRELTNSVGASWAAFEQGRIPLCPRGKHRLVKQLS